MDTPTPTLADVPSIGEEELHRQRVPLAKRAEEKYSGAGWKIYQWWRKLNAKHFGRQMEHCEIQFSSVPEKRFGLWRAEENAIVLGRSLLHQHGKVWRLYHEELGSNCPPDVLLRQVVLQYIEEVRGVKITDQAGVPIKPLSESEWWLREIERLSKKMDLEQPTSSREKNWWPYSVRPEGYYERLG